MAVPPRGPHANRDSRPAVLVSIAEAIRQVDAPSGLSVKVVAVDGHGGAGKSTLAAKLSEMLGAETVHTDEFQVYDGRPTNPSMVS